MAQIKVHTNLLDLGIPELTHSKRELERYFKLAESMDVSEENQMLIDLREQYKEVKSALKIAKMESKLYHLRLDIAEAKESYKHKYGEK